MFETNYFGACGWCRPSCRDRERGAGVVVNLSSVAERVLGPFTGFYAGTKYTLEALSESMHYELGHFGIRTVLVEPGVIETASAGSVRHHGKDTPPYDELWSQWDGGVEKLQTGEAPGPELVAGSRRRRDRGRGDAVPQPGRRGCRAHRRHAVAQMNDADFESTMRATLGLSW